jgi:hypothetical protein
MTLIYTVLYSTFTGVEREAEVSVHETTDQFGPCYYAMNLAIFGCGKNDRDPIGAVHRLVQEHGNVIAVRGSRPDQAGMQCHIDQSAA